jgi:hypothetical protein
MVISLCSLKFFGPFNQQKEIVFFFFNLRMISFFCMEICSQGIKIELENIKTEPKNLSEKKTKEKQRIAPNSAH